MLEISKEIFKEMCDLGFIQFKNARKKEYDVNYAKTKRKRQVEKSVYFKYLEFIKNNMIVSKRVFNELVELNYIAKDINSSNNLDFKFLIETIDKTNKKATFEQSVNKLDTLTCGFIENDNIITKYKVLKHPTGGKVVVNNGMWMYLPYYIYVNKNIYVNKSVYNEYIKYL